VTSQNVEINKTLSQNVKVLKKKQSMTITPIQRFWSLLKPYKFELRQIYAYAIFIGFVNLTLPLGIQAIVNYLQTGEVTSGWLVLVGFVLFGIAVTGILQVLQLRVVENIQQDLFARSGFEFAYRIPEIKFLQLDKVHAPELANRFFDTLTIQKGLPKILIDFSLAAFQIVFGLVLLAVYSPYFIIMGFALVLILWMIIRITGPDGLNTSLTESRYKYNLAHWLEEIARVNRSFKITTDSKLHLSKADDIIVRYLNARESHFGVLIDQFRYFIAFKVLLAASLLLLGGYLVFNERMNIGQFVAAEIIIILVINSVEKIIRLIDVIYDVLTALEKIGYVTDLLLDTNEGTALITSAGGIGIRAEGIAFNFPDSPQPIFEKLSFNLPKSSKVLLTGASGSGKTVLLQVLAGIHSLSDGVLYFNGLPFNNYNHKKLYQHVGVAFSTNQIFEGTFRENITMGRDISERKISAVMDLLQLNKYFVHRPQGLNGVVDSGGRTIPRSMIQKMLIARIIINEPKLLVMEDPLQFIENQEKKRIVDYLTDAQRPWTLIVVSDFDYWREKTTQVIDLRET